MQPRLVDTPLGPVEVVHAPGAATVLCFPGGHCPATVDCGWEFYTDLGLGLLAFSRPGYGRTDVGPLTAQRFVPVVEHVCRALGVTVVPAVVGVSFGGMQAVEVARSASIGAQRLVLASAAPSTLAYPDSAAQRLLAPWAFSPRVQHLTWTATRAGVRTDAGLRLMVGALSTRPLRQWWSTWSRRDRGRARELFCRMDSGRGFVHDLRQAGASSAAQRRQSLAAVPCPTLVTASRSDGGVDSRHAEDQASVVPGARLVLTDAPCHLFWLGPTAPGIAAEVAAFLSV